MDAQSFLMGSSNPGFSFRTPGDRIVGQIIGEPTVQQQKVFNTNDPAFWPSGDPKIQMLLPVQTSFRNWEGVATPEVGRPDTGARTIYVKGKHFEAGLKRAILEAGARFLAVGGWVDITFTGEDMESKAGSKPKLFAIRYMPPPPGSAPAPAQAAPVQAAGTWVQGNAPVYGNQLQDSANRPQYAQGGIVTAPASWQAAQPAYTFPPAAPESGYHSDPWATTPQAVPRPPAQAQPWYPQHAPVGFVDPGPVSPPPHHEQGPPPAWATGGPSAPPAQVSPAPQMSTLAAIRASQAEPANGADQAPF